MLRGYTLGWLGAIIVVVTVATVIVVGILRGGGASDEQAVRAWFQSPAGGSASKSLVAAIHVGTCSPADATNQSDPVFKCPITTTRARRHRRFLIRASSSPVTMWRAAAGNSRQSMPVTRSVLRVEQASSSTSPATRTTA
jgi:hypothetical protein